MNKSGHHRSEAHNFFIGVRAYVRVMPRWSWRVLKTPLLKEWDKIWITSVPTVQSFVTASNMLLQLQAGILN